ncbi:ABC transporter permease [Nisaea acidiphila]|uniref:ABC transporter permease n=1 Tax=Nisaea acidiphila TaxID=1862145 RepID=A0A9J7AVS4_9PROT|nr:ABC transporter permease [Nisaea acidiphila]UUX51439.1 ABC transporter permease [Nisaea acidiphila]
MDFNLMAEAFPKILDGLPVTMALAGISLFLGFFLAVGIALLRLSSFRPISALAYGFVYVFRGTPLLVQIFLIYYGTGQFEAVRESFLWPVLREAWWCAILALTLNTGAYTSEIIRGGILSVPFGQIEAAKACGMNALMRFRRIVFPQAIRQALPAYGNEIILMIKSTSLASTITLLEMTGIARKMISQTYKPLEIFLIAAVFYLTLVFVVTRAVAYVEFRLNPDRRAARTAKGKDLTTVAALGADVR